MSRVWRVLIGGTLVLLGTFFLLDNFGLVSTEVWRLLDWFIVNVWKLWPLFLIYLGMRIIRNSPSE